MATDQVAAGLKRIGGGGIYAITCEVGRRTYIGSAKNFVVRWRQHYLALRRGHHYNPRLQNAWNKYGGGAFTVTALMKCDEHELLLYEQACIDVALAGSGIGADALFNISLIAGSSCRGRKLSPEHCAKIGASRKGRKLSAEHVQALRESHQGQRPTPEAIAKTAAKNRGQKRTAEARARMSAIQRARPMTEARRAHLKRIRASQVFSAESRAKMSASHKAILADPIVRARLISSLRRACAKAAEVRRARSRLKNEGGPCQLTMF